MSSLQAQLSKLKPTTVFLPTTGTASILFSFTQASSLSPASIYPLARLSMQNLVLLQPILATFIAEFFPSNNFQDIYNRDLWTEKQNKEKTEKIKEFIWILQPFFNSFDGLKVIEFLIRCLNVHLFEGYFLFVSFLPFHNLKNFTKLIQNLDLNKIKAEFLKDIALKGEKTPQREIFVKEIAKNYSFLSNLIDFYREMKRKFGKNEDYEKFLAVLALETLKINKKEPFLRLLLSFLSDLEDLSSSIMIFVTIIKENKIKKEILEAFIEDILKKTDGNEKKIVIFINFLLQNKIIKNLPEQLLNEIKEKKEIYKEIIVEISKKYDVLILFMCLFISYNKEYIDILEEIILNSRNTLENSIKIPFYKQISQNYIEKNCSSEDEMIEIYERIIRKFTFFQFKEILEENKTTFKYFETIKKKFPGDFLGIYNEKELIQNITISISDTLNALKSREISQFFPLLSSVLLGKNLEINLKNELFNLLTPMINSNIEDLLNFLHKFIQNGDISKEISHRIANLLEKIVSQPLKNSLNILFYVVFQEYLPFSNENSSFHEKIWLKSMENLKEYTQDSNSIGLQFLLLKKVCFYSPKLALSLLIEALQGRQFNSEFESIRFYEFLNENADSLIYSNELAEIFKLYELIKDNIWCSKSFLTVFLRDNRPETVLLLLKHNKDKQNLKDLSQLILNESIIDYRNQYLNAKIVSFLLKNINFSQEISNFILYFSIKIEYCVLEERKQAFNLIDKLKNSLKNNNELKNLYWLANIIGKHQLELLNSPERLIDLLKIQPKLDKLISIIEINKFKNEWEILRIYRFLQEINVKIDENNLNILRDYVENSKNQEFSKIFFDLISDLDEDFLNKRFQKDWLAIIRNKNYSYLEEINEIQNFFNKLSEENQVFLLVHIENLNILYRIQISNTILNILLEKNVLKSIFFEFLPLQDSSVCPNFLKQLCEKVFSLQDNLQISGLKAINNILIRIFNEKTIVFKFKKSENPNNHIIYTSDILGEFDKDYWLIEKIFENLNKINFNTENLEFCEFLNEISSFLGHLSKLSLKSVRNIISKFFKAKLDKNLLENELIMLEKFLKMIIISMDKNKNRQFLCIYIDILLLKPFNSIKKALESLIEVFGISELSQIALVLFEGLSKKPIDKKREYFKEFSSFFIGNIQTMNEIQVFSNLNQLFSLIFSIYQQLLGITNNKTGKNDFFLVKKLYNSNKTASKIAIKLGLRTILLVISTKFFEKIISYTNSNKSLLKFYSLLLEFINITLSKKSIFVTRTLVILKNILEKFRSNITFSLLLDLTLGILDSNESLIREKVTAFETFSYEIDKLSNKKIKENKDKLIELYTKLGKSILFATNNEYLQKSLILSVNLLKRGIIDEENLDIVNFENKSDLVKALILVYISELSAFNEKYGILVEKTSEIFENLLELLSKTNLSIYLIPSIQNLVKNLKTIALPYINRIIQKLISLENDSFDLLEIIAKHIPIKVIVETIEENTQKNEKTNGKAILKLLFLLEKSIESSDFGIFVEFQKESFNILIRLLEFRKTNEDDLNVINVENKAFECFGAFALKCNEIQMRKYMLALVNWSEKTEKNKEFLFYRKILLLEITKILLTKLENYFVSFCSCLFDHFGSFLNSFHEVFSQKQVKKSLGKRKLDKSDDYYMNYTRLIRLYFINFTLVFKYDKEEFVDTQKFEYLAENIPKIIDCFYIDDYELDFKYETDLFELVSDFSIKLMDLVSDDYKWKTYHFNILLQTRTQSVSKPKRFVFRLIERLIETLKERYSSLINDLLPFLRENLDDLDGEVEKICRNIVIKLEKITGENVREYLKAL